MTDSGVNKKNRCYFCNKKIPLTLRGMACQCGFEFCALHRLPEEHKCTFDHREQHLTCATNKIDAMKCVAVKVEKI